MSVVWKIQVVNLVICIWDKYLETLWTMDKSPYWFFSVSLGLKNCGYIKKCFPTSLAAMENLQTPLILKRHNWSDLYLQMIA